MKTGFPHSEPPTWIKAHVPCMSKIRYVLQSYSPSQHRQVLKLANHGNTIYLLWPEPTMSGGVSFLGVSWLQFLVRLSRFLFLLTSSENRFCVNLNFTQPHPIYLVLTAKHFLSLFELHTQPHPKYCGFIGKPFCASWNFPWRPHPIYSRGVHFGPCAFRSSAFVCVQVQSLWHLAILGCFGRRTSLCLHVSYISSKVVSYLLLCSCRRCCAQFEFSCFYNWQIAASAFHHEIPDKA